LDRALTETEKQLLIGFFTLKAESKGTTMRNFIKNSRDYFLSFTRPIEKYSTALATLVEKGFIVIEKSAISLTEEGNAVANSLVVERPKMWYWYNEYYKKTFMSKTHLKFRKKMFGNSGIHSHSSTSLKQIKAIMDDLSLHGGKTILELGCGDGSVSEYISDKSDAFIVAIDNAPLAIKQARERTAAKKDKLTYVPMDINKLEFEETVFDGIFSIDTLYFVDIKNVLEKCYTLVKESGFIVLLYTYALQEDEPRENLDSENTPLGKILTEHEKQFFVRNFTDEVYDFVEKSKEIALKQKDAFISEDNESLYNDIIFNYNGVIEWQKNDSMRRYLYRITV